MSDGLTDRILRETGVPELIEILGDRLSPTDLQSLMLAVYRRRAAHVSPAELLHHYQRDRFVAPAPTDPRDVLEIEKLAWSLLPADYVAIELSPLCPLGTNSAMATVSQNKVVTTIRNTEVVSDSTNVMALEAASQRRDLLQSRMRRREPVLLAASQRLVRAQAFSGPRQRAHFRLLTLCAAGRDEGSFQFEGHRLGEQIAYYVALLRELGDSRSLRDIRVAVTDLTDGRLAPALEQHVLTPLSQAAIACDIDPTRTSGRGYYIGACFKIFATEDSGVELELADGGAVRWTRDLLGNAKERQVISGLAIERLAAAAPGGPERRPV